MHKKSGMCYDLKKIDWKYNVCFEDLKILGKRRHFENRESYRESIWRKEKSNPEGNSNNSEKVDFSEFKFWNWEVLKLWKIMNWTYKDWKFLGKLRFWENRFWEKLRWLWKKNGFSEIGFLNYSKEWACGPMKSFHDAV